MSVAAANATPTWFGHPRGLTVLFLTNMWEQFSYYGMRALLVYFMTRQLLLGQAQASLVYGAYTACAYFTPIIGGMMVDRFLGKRRAIIIGASVMAAGHFMMAFEPLFYLALATIALGNGLFLPTLPSQVGDLYQRDDPRRGRAYNVYYVGINIGGFLAPLACGTLGELYGWHYGFGLAGIGMLAGLLIYLFGGKHLPPDRPLAQVPQHAAPAGAFTRRTILTLIGIGVAVTVFRSAYEQVGNTVALWSDQGVDRQAGGWLIPVTWFQSLNPLFVMLMTPPLLAWWRRRADAHGDQPPAQRMALGALMLSGAYLMLAGLVWLGDGQPTPWPWLVLFFAAFTIGELFILPTGLGLFARLAPAGRTTTTVGAWFLIIFSGSLSAGAVGSLWSRLGHSEFFVLLAALAALAALLLQLLNSKISPSGESNVEK
ncbi:MULTISPECIES: peptide MFS transporter [unclassified Duganella]|uniref:peptide MFS transporter n=1 Tax=unclassified Duganella TaxID=2636909 RepID=UPI00088CC753|nr:MULTISPECIES: peptide MFS transporter [unclassified Duganella]SDG52662.1 proton-dependent oligopeptide transporter, POT family [Duganella sp. OV458]SDJ75459.1 proton-dependent oligopeptide transporter, POT family [Duganella sp. OV510]